MKTQFSNFYLVIVCLFCFISSNTFAKNYYIDPSSKASAQLGTLAYPWTLVTQLNNSATLAPGDTVFFKNGQTFAGNLYFKASGTLGHPIVYTGYGAGSYPIINYYSGQALAIHIANASYVVVDGFKIIDSTLLSDINHNTVSNIKYGIFLENSSNCTIKNCDISLVGTGIQLDIGSNYSTVTHNHIYNLRMNINTPASVNSYDDYGANGVCVAASYDTISYNKFEDAWATSYDYGIDGGVIELSLINNGNYIAYNTSVNCAGFVEVGGNGAGTSTSTDNVVAYNKIINCGDVGFFHSLGSGFGTSISNFQIYNNTVIVTKAPLASVLQLFGKSGTDTNSGMLVIKNNIFWLTTGINFTDNSFTTNQMIHTNNIYHLTKGTLGITLNSNEQSQKGTLFVDTTGDPANWNYNILPGNSAIGFGTNVNIAKDFVGNPVVGNPDAGILQFISSTTTLSASATAGAINCYGDSTFVTVSATGGVAPYTGTGKFLVKAGTYNFTVTDARGINSIATLTVSQPSAISMTLTAGTIASTGLATTLSVAASGGTIPYAYSLNGGTFQSANSFTNVLAGIYTVVTTDANGCSTSQSITINQPLTGKGNFSISIAPNYSTNYFILDVSNYTDTKPIVITIFNSQGILVYSASVSAANRYTFGNSFVSGIYFVHLGIGQFSQTYQVVKI